MDHVKHINQVADHLRKAGVGVRHIHIDDPEQALELGRDYGRIDLEGAGLAQSLVWADHRGWMTSTHADHYPIQDGRTHPDPADVAREAATHIHTLRHGGYLRPA